MMMHPALAGSLTTDRTVRPNFLHGGEMLLQGSNTNLIDLEDERLSSSKTDLQIKTGIREDLVVGISICQRTRSNTIVLIRDGMLLGLGSGVSRVAAVHDALYYASEEGRHSTENAIAISDSFFPAVDAPMKLIEAGIKVIFTTRGSIKDDEVAAAIKNGGAELIWGEDKYFRAFYGH
jgi:phosphoribosylaminoimidazolecarboxamide formyltransferase/IMP cyclohydrolase